MKVNRAFQAVFGAKKATEKPFWAAFRGEAQGKSMDFGILRRLPCIFHHFPHVLMASSRENHLIGSVREAVMCQRPVAA